MKITICNNMFTGSYYRLTCLIDDKLYVQESFVIQTIEYYVDKISNKET